MVAKALVIVDKIARDLAKPVLNHVALAVEKVHLHSECALASTQVEATSSLVAMSLRIRIDHLNRLALILAGVAIILKCPKSHYYLGIICSSLEWKLRMSQPPSPLLMLGKRLSKAKAPILRCPMMLTIGKHTT